MVYSAVLPQEKIGGLSAENVKEFFYALSAAAGMNLHIDVIRGDNTHHIVEAIFKAFARAFREAIEIEPRVEGAWSSKGSL